MDEFILVSQLMKVNLTTNIVDIITTKQWKDEITGVAEEKYRIIPMHPDLRDIHMQYLVKKNIMQVSPELLFPIRSKLMPPYIKKIQNEIGVTSKCTQVQAHLCGEGHNGNRPTECTTAVDGAFFRVYNINLHKIDRIGYLRVYGESKMKKQIER